MKQPFAFKIHDRAKINTFSTGNRSSACHPKKNRCAYRLPSADFAGPDRRYRSAPRLRRCRCRCDRDKKPGQPKSRPGYREFTGQRICRRFLRYLNPKAPCTFFDASTDPLELSTVF